jgi:putative addiction module killer protein
LTKIKAKGELVGSLRRLGDHVTELKFDFGPGYRVYVTEHRARLIVLLAGGDKSTQDRDIAKATQLAREWREQNA